MNSQLKNNAFLAIALYLLLLVVFSASSSSQPLKVEPVATVDIAKTLSVKKAHSLSLSGQLTLVDIRSEQEWFQSGIAPQALLISMHQVGGMNKFSQDLLSALDGNKDTPVALICASGLRSARLQKHLAQEGFTHIIDVSEGMLGSWSTEGWIKQNLPVKSFEKQ
jgi:rhodanese-related sulfurtransferase